LLRKVRPIMARVRTFRNYVGRIGQWRARRPSPCPWTRAPDMRQHRLQPRCRPFRINSRRAKPKLSTLSLISGTRACGGGQRCERRQANGKRKKKRRQKKKAKRTVRERVKPAPAVRLWRGRGLLWPSSWSWYAYCRGPRAACSIKHISFTVPFNQPDEASYLAPASPGPPSVVY
jgi:hypothetical protein